MKTCRTCKQKKEYSEFGIKKVSIDGYNNQCKVCEREYQREYIKGYRKKLRTDIVDTSYIDMTGTRKAEWCMAYRILSKMNYNPEIDIHTQFIERHPELVYKPRPKSNSQTFTWKDCI